MSINAKVPFRPEIQGLRAIAVALVAVFHIWPDALPGGYIGVDVFFVISGFLITGLLVRELEQTRRVSLLNFYVRRIRRLLPIATLVLLVTAIASLLFLPASRWEATALEIAAAAMYVENWVLAWQSVDYWAADAPNSPVTHFWSLSIEEQFYFVWPLLIICAATLSRRLGYSARPVLLSALSLIFAGSLYCSMVITPENPAQAYFFTHTRIWELALGGMLAIWRPASPQYTALRWALVVTALGAIFWSALSYSPETLFPGVAALVPTVATAVLIWAGDVRLAGRSPLSNALMRYIGDRSYSIYLWHWPLITFYLVQVERIGLLDGLALLGATLLLSHLSFQHVEERFRHQRAARERAPLVLGFASVVLCVVASAGLYTVLAGKVAEPLVAADADYPGPLAMLESIEVPANIPLRPSLATLNRDMPLVHSSRCHQNMKDPEASFCVLGDPEGDRSVALVGDSLAAQWSPALDVMARSNGWRLYSFTKSACPFSSSVKVVAAGIIDKSCLQWQENVLNALDELSITSVVTSQYFYPLADRSEIIEGTLHRWQQLLDRGTDLFAIAVTPRLRFQPGDCLDRRGNCVMQRAEALPDVDPIKVVAARLPEVTLVDMTPFLCSDEECPAAIGNLVVWRDRSHLSATYATALTPFLEARMPLDPARHLRDDVAPSQAADGVVRVLPVVLACTSARSGEVSARNVGLRRAGSKLFHQRGDFVNRQEWFEEWSGSIEGTQVELHGIRGNGEGSLLEMAFSGVSSPDGNFVLTGFQGRRECTLSGSLL